jgi:hypothetical protein
MAANKPEYPPLIRENLASDGKKMSSSRWFWAEPSCLSMPF